jgi:hypothetical protein
MKKLAIGLLVALLSGVGVVVHAADLFDNNKLNPIAAGEPVAAGATIGGYAIYPGDGRWKFDSGKADFVVGPTPIWMGNVTMTHRQDSQLVAWQTITANLNRSLDTAGWRGGACTNEHVVKKSSSSGNNQACLTIDPHVNNSSSRNTLYLGVGITHTSSKGRYQKVYVAINTEVFGFRNLGPGDWSRVSLDGNPRRREFIDRLTTWAETLQAAAGTAFQQNEAGDFYRGVPSYMTLMTVPDDLKGGEFSLGFLGAVEDLKDKGGFKAIAYSKNGPGATRWASTSSQATQDDADKGAMDSCERERAPSRPPCRLYTMK